MPNHSWTLEQELCNHTRCARVCEALSVLGLLSNPGSEFQLIGGEWERGGAETYLSRFRFLSHDQPGLDILIKACAPSSPGVDLDSVLAEWIKRRCLLSNHGIATPRLYSSGQGVLIEEYVPHELRTVLTADRETSRNVLDQLVRYAATLLKLGFAPVDPFKDLRSHGNDIVVVDFGADLGPAGIKPVPHSRIFQKLHQYILPLGLNLERSEYVKMNNLSAASGG